MVALGRLDLPHPTHPPKQNRGLYQFFSVTQLAREETCCSHYIDYSFRLAERILLYASSHRHDMTAFGSPCRIDPTTHRTMSERSFHGATSRSRLSGSIKSHCLKLQYTARFSRMRFIVRINDSAFLKYESSPY